MFVDGEQCEIGASPDDESGEHFWIFFWMLVLGLLWLGLLVTAVKFVQWTREELRQHAWQLADADRAYIVHQNSIDRTMEQVSALEGWVTGLEGQITMVSDYSESVHHGLVELGGFTRVTDLTAEEGEGSTQQRVPTWLPGTLWVPTTTYVGFDSKSMELEQGTTPTQVMQVWRKVSQQSQNLLKMIPKFRQAVQGTDPSEQRSF